MIRNNLYIITAFMTILVVSSLSGQNMFKGSDGWVRLNSWEVQVLSATDTVSALHDSWLPLTDFKAARYSIPVFRFRSQIHISPGLDPTKHLCVHFRRIGSAYSVYLDGEFLGTNGIPSAQKTLEVPANYFRTILLPDTISPGEHWLELELSDWRQLGQNGLTRTQLGYWQTIQLENSRTIFILLFESGVFFMAALLSFSLFLGVGWHRAYLFFGIFSIVNIVFPASAFIVNYLQIPMTWIPVINGITGLMPALGIGALNIFFLVLFPPAYQRYHILVNIVLTGIFLFYRPGQVLGFYSLYAFLPLLMAYRNRLPGAKTAFTGMVVYSISLIAYFYGIIFISYVIIDIVFVFFMMLSISRRIRKEAEEKQRALVRSSRLEAELLKKQLHPHYIMNTLLSIISWIEAEPEKATELIESLAEEFRILHEVHDKQLISLEREIELCENHIQIMSLRKNADYSFVKKGEINGIFIPPLVLHTIVENAFSHAFVSNESGKFELIVGKDDLGWVHVELGNNGSRIKDGLLPDGFKEGMGSRYIKSRLKEAFGNKWNYSVSVREGKWWTQIKFKTEKKVAHFNR